MTPLRPPPRGRARPRGPSAPTSVVGEELHFFQGAELLLGAAGHAEGGGAEPAIPDVQVAGIHEEHVSGRQETGGDRLRAGLLLGVSVGLKK